jgi:hypothetical protein
MEHSEARDEGGQLALARDGELLKDVLQFAPDRAHRDPKLARNVLGRQTGSHEGSRSRFGRREAECLLKCLAQARRVLPVWLVDHDQGCPVPAHAGQIDGLS